MIYQRSSGILLHPTSLPGPDGIGDLGPEAYRWVDFLHASGTQLWQILPLGPTGYGDSPYQCFSAFAGNPFLVSPILLLESGLLKSSDLRQRPEFPESFVDFGPVILWKNHLLDRAYENYQETKPTDISARFKQFQIDNANWLEDYGLFMAIKEIQGGHPWSDWDKALKFRDQVVLEKMRSKLADVIDKVKFSQFLFDEQWQNLKNYAHSKGISIIGDMPFVIAMDSADTWANPQLFLMDNTLTPTMVAGVPPDYFSATGQLWGNPLYNWEVHANQQYEWWASRLGKVLSMVDLVRLDHFRGFAAAWHVPFGSETAIHGEWIASPGVELFSALKARLPRLPIIAEDLGVITPDVEALRDGFGFPGMKILQFGFSGDPEDSFLPHHYPVNCFAYTGSHDNDTARGWFDHASPREQRFCLDYLGTDEVDVPRGMIREVWRSVANYAVAPMQDFLGLGTEARMNLPGSASGNWTWRIPQKALNDGLKDEIYALNFLYSRLPEDEKRKNQQRFQSETSGTVKPH
ncbi:MAG: 4-alpha-glucanotransferase [Anaerolineaceae bacterium]|jgi:4-alpha-glucanotransferase|nr:4-alpha-glucanotransferase [Chloroflexota bacterium]